LWLIYWFFTHFKEFFRLFAVLCGYPHKNQRGLELKIILSIENDEEPFFNLLYRHSKPVTTPNVLDFVLQVRKSYLRKEL